MANKKSDIDKWLSKLTPYQRKALENASKNFSDRDNFDINSIESIFGIESSFGSSEHIGVRGSDGPAGYFQQKKNSAIRYGLIVTKKNDERFNLAKSAISAAKQIKDLDNLFSKRSNLGGGIFTSPVLNALDRELIAVAAYNIGEGRIAKAQAIAIKNGEDAGKWQNIVKYLKEAGANDLQIEEVKKYIEKYLELKKEFAAKSELKNLKNKNIEDKASEGCHWITKHGDHICIENKK